MGFHGNALELHWIRGQKLRVVYWKRERDELEEIYQTGTFSKRAKVSVINILRHFPYVKQIFLI